MGQVPVERLESLYALIYQTVRRAEVEETAKVDRRVLGAARKLRKALERLARAIRERRSVQTPMPLTLYTAVPRDRYCRDMPRFLVTTEPPRDARGSG